MGSIIDKLMEIETIASRIRESVSFRKQELQTQIEEDKRDYDRQLSEEYRAELEVVRQELETQHQKDVAEIHREADRVSGEMDAYFTQHQEAMAEELFEKIIRM